MFKLLRYFSITSFIITAVAASALGIFYRQQAFEDLLELGESKNIALAQAFANSLLHHFTPFLRSATSLPPEELRAHPETVRLGQEIRDLSRGLPVVKVKMYDLAGRTVFSTEAKQIGEDKSTNAAFLSARSGKITSYITHRDTFNAFEGIIENRDLLASYVPIRAASGPVEGVFELYYDMTHLLERMKRTQRTVVLGVVLILALLYVALFFLVRHADRVLRRQTAERQRAEEALAQQSALLQATLDNTSQGIVAFDKDLRMVAWNTRFLDLRDFPRAFGQAGKPFADFVRYSAERGEYGPGDPERQVEGRVARARRFGPRRVEHTSPTGRVLELHRNPIPSGGFVTTYTDITERKQADATRQALHRAGLQIQEALTLEERLSRFMQTAREILNLERVNVLLADPSGRWLQAVASLGTGQPLEEIRVPIGPEGGGLARAFLTGQAVVWNGQGPVPEELRLKPPYDRIEAFRSRVFINVPLVVHGRTIGVIGADRKRSQRPFEPGLLDLLQLFGGQAALAIEHARLFEALAQQSALLQATLDNVTQGISAFDRDLRLVAWNQRYFDLRALPPAFARRGTPFEDIIRYNVERGEYGPGDPEEHVAQRLALARTREPQRFERTRPNGTIIEVRRNPMPGGGLVTTLTDITERKQAEQMKSDFVSFVTHQLRTPLSGIKWLLELAAQGPEIPEESRSYIVDAQAAADRLVGLVNDLLDISQLERGKLNIVPRETRLEELTQGVVDELAPLIAEKGHRLSVTGAEHLPPIWVDPQLLRQVVLNLASNAIKYTPPGGEIAIRMGQEDAAVHWAIQDSGIGIPKEAQGRLFEKFYRADNVYAIETEGTGLGLYLARLIVTQFGGRVWCDSEEGKGATFTFTLPVGGRG